MQKAAIRKIYKQKRKELSFSAKAKIDDLMLIKFQQLPIMIPSVIMSYSAIEKFSEFDPELITEYCYFKNSNQCLCFPVMRFNIEGIGIQAVIVDDETFFKDNAFGVPEPIGATNIETSQIELFIVPLLSFDKNGYRVGYGKGYYDRFLKDRNKDSITVGFSYFDPVERISDTDEYDVRLDYCITPDEIFTF